VTNTDDLQAELAGIRAELRSIMAHLDQAKPGPYPRCTHEGDTGRCLRAAEHLGAHVWPTE